MRPPQVALTLDEGQYDPRRGLWFVTGPQPERDVYATIELSRVYPDDVSELPRVRYRWYLNRRSVSRLEQIADGAAGARDEALRQIAAAWTRLIGTA